MSYEFIDVQHDAGVCIITLNRPEKLNAITVQMDTEWTRAVRAAIADDDVRVILQCGRGRMFSAGHDIVEIGQIMKELGGNDVDWLQLYARCWPEGSPADVTARCPKPVISAVRGMVVGQAIVPVFYSDMIIAGTGTLFNTEVARTGGGGGLQCLTGVLPNKLMSELAYLGTLTAETLLAAGVINRVVPSGEVTSEALTIARAVAKVHPQSTQGFKRIMHEMFDANGIGVAANLIAGGSSSHGGEDDNSYYMRAAEHGVDAAVRWRDDEFGGGGYTSSKGMAESTR